MLPTSIDNTTSAQQRLKRFIRQPEKLESRQLTRKGLELLATVERYHLLPSSMLVRLVAGDRSNNHRHLQTLFHRGLVNRFAMTTLWGTPGEFVYYLDSIEQRHGELRSPVLDLLIQHNLLSVMSEEEYQRKVQIIRYNRQKNWAGLHKDPDMQGKLLYIQHELMVSRFRFMLEMACRHPKHSGKVTLEQWKQGPELWNRIELPKVRPHHRDEQTKRMVWEELEERQYLPHRPDAFFSLYFPGNPPGRDHSHFFYEADRGTERTNRYKMKLRAHWHFVVKHNQQRTALPYQVHSIRAVLTETTSTTWRDNLVEAAKENVISNKPSPLFWFASSEDLIQFVPDPDYLGRLWKKLKLAGTPNIMQLPEDVRKNVRTVPHYLLQPEVIFSRLWHGCVDGNAFNLAD